MLKKLQLFKNNFGCIIVPFENQTNALLLNRKLVNDLVEKSGAVIFRGFETDTEKFKLITENFSGNFMSHLAPSLRPAVGKDPTMTEVLSGNGLIHLHGEMFYVPIRPDFLWLYCVKPAISDGETTVCSSIDFFNTLSDTAKNIFQNHRIQYHFSLTPEQVRSGLGETPQQIKQTLSLKGVNEFYLDKEGNLNFSSQAWAVVTLKNGKKGFINSIANILQYTNSAASKSRIVLDNGQPLGKILLEEIMHIGESIAQKIEWEAGDVLVVDNSWVMHGRRPFEGERKILTRFGMAA